MSKGVPARDTIMYKVLDYISTCTQPKTSVEIFEGCIETHPNLKRGSILSNISILSGRGLITTIYNMGTVNTYEISKNGKDATDSHACTPQYSHYGDDTYIRILEILESGDVWVTARNITDAMHLSSKDTGGIGSRLLRLAADSIIIKRTNNNINEYRKKQKFDVSVSASKWAKQRTGDSKDKHKSNEWPVLKKEDVNTLPKTTCKFFTVTTPTKDKFKEADLKTRIDELKAAGESTHEIAWECFVSLQPMVDNCIKINLQKEADELKESGSLLYDDYEKIKKENMELKEQLQIKKSSDMIDGFKKDSVALRKTHSN